MSLHLSEASTPTEAPTVFNHPEFGELRTVEISGEPWFVGKDVATALGYSDTFGALKKHVDAADKQNCQNDSFDTPRGQGSNEMGHPWRNAANDHYQRIRSLRPHPQQQTSISERF